MTLRSPLILTTPNVRPSTKVMPAATCAVGIPSAKHFYANLIPTMSAPESLGEFYEDLHCEGDFCNCYRYRERCLCRQHNSDHQCDRCQRRRKEDRNY